jgi:hypothetical protein
MSLYHLHIPRTAGGSARKALLDSGKYINPVVGHYRTISKSDFLDSDFISGHYGATPFDHATSVFTIIRNPVDLTYSYIKYLSGMYGPDFFNEDFLKKYLYEDNLRESVSNALTKFICLSTDIERYNKNIDNHLYMAHNTWCLEPSTYNADLALSAVETNKITIFSHEQPDLIKQILEFAGVETRVINQEKLNASIVDKEELFESYYDELKLANNIDVDLYERLTGEKLH